MLRGQIVFDIVNVVKVFQSCSQEGGDTDRGEECLICRVLIFSC